jgi:hypothetical protein
MSDSPEAKARKRECNQRSYRKHREKILAYAREYNQRPEVKAHKREYRRENREKRLAHDREYDQRPEVIARRHQRYGENREKILAQQKEYRQRPEVKARHREYNLQYRLKHREEILA